MSMISFWRIFFLELKALWRSGTLPITLIVSALWMLFSPCILTGDGTVEGAREIYTRYSMGGVFALTLIVMIFASTASIAGERKQKRLNLTLIRPIRYSFIALAKIFALTFAGFAILFLSGTILALKASASRPCNHVLSPVKEDISVQAESEYGQYMSDPRTPEIIKTSPKDEVIRVLERDIANRLTEIKSLEREEWLFDIPESFCAKNPSAEIRFSNLFALKGAIYGKLEIGDREARFEHVSDSMITIPLKNKDGKDSTLSGKYLLTFENLGDKSVLVRKNRDVKLLIPADEFIFNLARTLLELTSLLCFVIALSVFLASTMSRPVATFVAMVVLILSEMSPSITANCDDDIYLDKADKFGLRLNRAAEVMTKPLTAVSPLESLSRDICVENKEASDLAIVDLLIVPPLFSLLSALGLLYKKED